MGTNYYLYKNCCAHCGRGDDSKHIGKSSSGWVFSLNTHHDEGISSLKDWEEAWATEGAVIKDEYGQVIPIEEMVGIITRRSWGFRKEKPPGYYSWEEFHQKNHSLPGPNGLLRHQIDGSHCIAHGEGTYDLMQGDFC